MNNANIRKRCSRQSCSSSSSFPAPLTRLYQEALPTCSFQENRLDYKRIQLSFTKRWNLCIGWEHFTTADWISFWNSTLRHRPEHQTSLHDLFITFIAPFKPVVHFRVLAGIQIVFGQYWYKMIYWYSPCIWVHWFTEWRVSQNQRNVDPKIMKSTMAGQWRNCFEVHQ